MKMMKLNYLVVGIISAVSASAYAQQITVANAPPEVGSGVTVYGVLDAGVRSSSGLGLSATSSPSASPTNTTALASGADRSGRWGITGGEVLSDGFKASFTLESDLYVNSGNTNPNLGAGKDTTAATTNKLFERLATVSLAGSFGKISLGRQQSALRDIIDDIDAIGGRFTSFNPNLQYTSLNSSSLVASPATYYGSGNPGNDSMMRQDNAVKYSLALGDVNAIVDYSLGGVAGSTQSNSSAQAALSYHAGPVLVSGAYEALNNNTDTLKLTAYTVGGRYIFGDWQLAANYGSNSADRTVTTNIKTTIASVGTTYAATSAIDLTLGYYQVQRTWSANVKPDASIHRVIGFAEYKFSKHALAFVEFDHNQWGGDASQFQGAATNKASSSGLTLGLDYKI